VAKLTPRSAARRKRALRFCGTNAVHAVGVLLCGCGVGPDFHRPASPTDASFAPKALPAASASAAAYGGDAQRFVSGQDIRFDWWTAFKSPQLNSLVEKALRANPTIESAKAALRQAHELP
jgi:outer membrane protein TolC